MSSYRPTYAPDERNRPSPIDRNPNYGQQSNSQQPSFKTNVNRMKTKRWVNAKTYSYDGDDWGESEDEGDDDEDGETNPNQPPYSHQQPSHPPLPRSTPAVPALPLQQQTGSLPPTQGSFASTGVSGSDASQAADVPGATPQPHLGTGDSSTVNDDQGASDSKPLPFIRPADIYKRLAEQKQKEKQQALGSATNSEPDAPGGTVLDDSPAPKESNVHSPGSRAVERGTEDPEGLAANDTTEAADHRDHVVKQQETYSPTSVPEPEPASQLLQIKHLSVFGNDFMGETVNDKPKTTEESPGDLDTTSSPNIPRNTSLGFRSAVHQAFDTPDTPATSGSLARTDSEGSTISPIIRPNTLTASSNSGMHSANQTPTIEEEPCEQVQTPRQSQLVPANFKPGHRRSMTPPSSENSPARKPILTTNMISPDSERADLAESTPSGATRGHSPRDTSPAHSARGDKESSSTDTISHRGVSPTLNSNSPPRADSRPSSSTSNHKRMLDTPSLGVGEEEKRHSLNLTVQTGGADVAPDAANMPLPDPHSGASYGQETTIDTPVNPTTSSSELNADISSYLQVAGEPRSTNRRESTLIPSEYDSYWNEKGENMESLKPLPLRPSSADRQSTTATPQEIQTSAPADDVTIATTANIDNDLSNNNNNAPNHQMERKFSWELEAGAINPPQARLPPLPGQQPNDQQLPQTEPSSASSAKDPAQQSLPDKDAVNNDLQASPLSSKPASRAASPTADATDPTKVINEAEEVSAPNDFSESNAEPFEASGAAVPSSNPFENRKLKGFREITQMEPRSKRIAAFNESREIFANGDMRLSAWVQHMADSHPEHGDLIAKNGAPQGPVVQRTATSGKFPKLSSLGSISLPSSSSHHEGGSSPHSHARHPSITPLGGMMNSQQVQARGKDLLHSAGVFGGKAGGAAKGFFAKGRSKFRHSGSDKGASIRLPARPQESPMSRQDTTTRSRHDSIEGGPRSDAGIPHVGSLNLDFESLSVSMATAAGDGQGQGSQANNSVPTTPFKRGSTPLLHGPKHQSYDPTEQPTGMSNSWENSNKNHGSGAGVLNLNSRATTKASVPEQNLDDKTIPEQRPYQDGNPSLPTDYANTEAAQAISQSGAVQGDSTRSGSVRRAGDGGTELEEDDEDDNCGLPIQSNNANGQVNTPEDDHSMEIHGAGESQRVVERQRHEAKRSQSPAPLPSNSQGHPLNGKVGSKEYNGKANRGDRKSEKTARKHGPSKSVEKAQLSAFISSISPDEESDSEEITVYMSPGQTESGGSSIAAPANGELRTLGSAALPHKNNSRPEAYNAAAPENSNNGSGVQNDSIHGGNQGLSRKFSFENNNVIRMKGLPALPTTNGQAAPSPSYRRTSMHNPHSRGYTAPTPDVIQRPHSAAQVTNPHHDRVNSSKPHAMRQKSPTLPAAWERQRAEPNHITSRFARVPSFMNDGENPPVVDPKRPTAFIPATTKTRSRSGSAISGIMSKVSIGRSRNEDTGDAAQGSEKRNNFKFRSLRLDTKAGQDTGPVVGRHSSLQVKPTEQQTHEQRDGKGMLYNARRRGSSLVSSTEQEMKGSISKMRNFIARSSQSAGGGNGASPAPKSARLQTSSLPSTPQESLASRPGRFYSSLNPALYRVNEQPESPRVEEQRESSFAPQRAPMVYNPATTSLGQQYNPPSRQHAAPSFPPMSNFPPPHSSVNGYVGDPFAPPKRAHTADLHIRSRSPSSHQPDAHLSSAVAAAENNSHPASQLGMFHSTVDDSSRNGGQQRPWNVAMPRDQDDKTAVDPSRYPLPRSNKMSPVNPAAAGIPPPPPPKIPLQADATGESPSTPRSVNTARGAVELPAPVNNAPIQAVELPTNDDSSEEIVMSSTAYPGQEWQPAYLGHWD